jgi:WS/DGAT/MGAT family acyltransferase
LRSSVTPQKKNNAAKGIVDFLRAARKLLSEVLIAPAKSSLNGHNSDRRFLRCVDLPWQVLQEMRQGNSWSINDLLLSVVSGAVRRYHLVHGGNLQPLRLVMPVSLRRDANAKTLGNQLTATGVSVALEPQDSVTRLKAIHENVIALKKGGGLIAYGLIGKINALLPLMLLKKISEAQARRTNFICTNMAGPAEPEYIAGAKILGHYGMAALMRGHGISVSFVSYCDKLCIGIVGDLEIVKAPDALSKFMLESFEELSEHLLRITHMPVLPES